MYEKVVGQKIKKAVKEIGLTHAQFEKKIKIGKNMISVWATGKRNPSLKSLKKIAGATDKPLNYFFDNLENISYNDNNSGIIRHLNSGNTLNSDNMETINKKLENIQNNINDKFKMLELKLDLILEKLKKWKEE